MVSFSFADSWLDPAYGLWGVGAVSRDRKYVGIGPELSPGVFIFGGFGPVFIEANRFGYSFYMDGTYFASVAAQIRSHQFITKDDGFNERKRAFEAGIQFGRRLPAGLVTRVAFLHDVIGSHKSWEVDWQLFRRNRIGSLRLLTALGIQYQAKNLVDYYYGTDAYKPNADLVGEIELIATFPVGNWGIFAGTRLYFYNEEVTNSPIAEGSSINLFFTGIGYYF
jgi:outer membrane scaffolding protein for murein synthesis (MipA/OmpV family)